MRSYRDRIGRHFVIGPWWLRLGLVVHPSMWAGSLHAFRRTVWLRPINYEAIAHA